MITFFTTYKSFEGQLALTQTNAIKSWYRLGKNVEIILFDENAQAEKIAKRFGLRYIPNIKKNEKGTPYLSEMFAETMKLAINDLVCYINCDIILPQDFLEKVAIVNRNLKHKYLLVGRRYNMDVDSEIPFTNTNEMNAFFAAARKQAMHYDVSAIDYFLFPRYFYNHIPPFLAGRAGFDNWLVWYGRRHGTVVDGSDSLFVIHQNHDYMHLYKKKQGSTKKFKNQNVCNKLGLEGEDKIYNKQFLGKKGNRAMNILDATWKLQGNVLVKKNSPEERMRYVNRLHLVYPEIAWLIIMYKKFKSVLKRFSF
ncbi:MAG: glycosyltransferase family 2 protein [Fibrobacteria bacterium]|nr:glycosyltransferase family 2 protein [Fibrobacteria bacterium]